MVNTSVKKVEIYPVYTRIKNGTHSPGGYQHQKEIILVCTRFKSVDIDAAYIRVKDVDIDSVYTRVKRLNIGLDCT